MKSIEQIFDRCRNPRSFLGFDTEALLMFITFDEVKTLLKGGPPLDNDEGWEALPRTQEAVVAEMGRYMEFAWGKVEDHRGISAGRSIEKMEAWLWLLDDEETLAALKGVPYENYGAPKLKVICDKYGFPVPQDDQIKNMIAGRPCRKGCQEGCVR